MSARGGKSYRTTKVLIFALIFEEMCVCIVFIVVLFVFGNVKFFIVFLLLGL